MATTTCASCGATLKPKPTSWTIESLVAPSPVEIKGRLHCHDCARKYVDQAIASVRLTTTHGFDGYRVRDYLGVESTEVVLGTGPFSEFTADVADLFGTRATDFEKKLQTAKRAALDKLRLVASESGANAVIGVDLDYTEFSGNRIGVVASGTMVAIVPV